MAIACRGITYKGDVNRDNLSYGGTNSVILNQLFSYVKLITIINPFTSQEARTYIQYPFSNRLHVNSTKFLIGHLTISFIFLTQINFLNSIFFVRVDIPLFYENLGEPMPSRFVNSNTNLGRNTTLGEKIHTLICDNFHILI